MVEIAVTPIMLCKATLCHLVIAIRDRNKAMDIRTRPDTGPETVMLTYQLLSEISPLPWLSSAVGLPMPPSIMALKTKYAVVV
jgi:hypothetical protein